MRFRFGRHQLNQRSPDGDGLGKIAYRVYRIL